jgi:hypothetical protein
VCIIERRCRLQVQRREHLYAFALCDELVVLDLAAPALGVIAGEKDCFTSKQMLSGGGPVLCARFW